MLAENIEKELAKGFDVPPTKDQQNALRKFADFILDYHENKVFILTGYAGTGKTTLMSVLINALSNFNLKSVLLAPTGRAAKVLSGYSGKKAWTIHKVIYRQRSASDGFGRFELNKNLHKDTLFIVDEAGMVGNETNAMSLFGTGSLLNDLLEYVYSGTRCKLVLCGDNAQLPPVGYEKSPALENTIIQQRGYQTSSAFLSEVVRQASSSEILENATKIRNLIDQQVLKTPQLTMGETVRLVNGIDLIDCITSSYDKVGIHETIIINRSNKRANQYNLGVRNQILWREEELTKDDYLMIVKNNYHWNTDEIDFLANGDTAIVNRVSKRESLYGYDFADVSIELPDYGHSEIHAKVLLNTLTLDSPALTSEQNRSLYYTIMEDYSDIKTKKEKHKKIKDNAYFNALQIKFAYAVTCHKAQGGQWKHVYIDLGYFTEDMINEAFLRWLYTAFTRATERIFLVNFPKAFL